MNFTEHLVHTADQRRTTAAAGAAHASPQMRLDIALDVGHLTATGLRGHTQAAGVQSAGADLAAFFVVQFGDQFAGVLARFGLGVAHDHVHTQTVVQHAAVMGGTRMHIAHTLRQHLAGFRPHQVHITVRTTQLQRRRTVAAEVQERAAVLLVRPDRVGAQALELVDLAFVIDLVLRPGLLEDLDDLPGALVAVVTVGFFTREIGGNDVQRQPALEHVVQRGHGTRQHGGVHLTAADGCQQIDARGQRRHGGHKAQRVLPHLVRRGAQHIAKAMLLSVLHDAAGVLPAAAQITLRHAQMAKVI